MRTRAARSGFTLSELLIIVVVLGLLAAVGIPAYRQNIEQTPLPETPRVQTHQVAERTFIITTRKLGRDAHVIAEIRRLGCADIVPFTDQMGRLTGAVVRCEAADTEEAEEAEAEAAR